MLLLYLLFQMKILLVVLLRRVLTVLEVFVYSN